MPWLVGGNWLASYGIASAVALLVGEETLKRIIASPRPARTALVDEHGAPRNGMPSGHTLNSLALLTWQLLEIRDANATGGGWWVVVDLVLLLPVPWARWYNGDHTGRQVGITGVVAVAFGVAMHYLRVAGSTSGMRPAATTRW